MLLLLIRCCRFCVMVCVCVCEGDSEMENLIVLCENMTIAFHMFRLAHGENRGEKNKQTHTHIHEPKHMDTVATAEHR